jgi:acyl dehydratase
MSEPTRAPIGEPDPESVHGARAPRHYWEDFPPGSVREFGGMAVEREAVIAFASAFDPQPFHLDDAAAEASLFGRLSASGWHTCAMTMRMMCDAYLLDAASLGSPGIDSLRWLKPVYPGDRLTVTGTIVDKTPSRSKPEIGSVRTETVVTNQDEVPVMRFTSIVLMRRRPA